MNAKKQLLTSVLCASLILASFAGCSGKENPGSAPDSSAGVSASSDMGTASQGGEENPDASGEATTTPATDANGSQVTQATTSKNNVPGGKTTTKPGGSKGNPLEGVDLKGATIVIGTSSKDMFNTKKGSSKRLNAIADRFNQLQSKLHCTIKVEYKEDSDALYQAAFNASMSGKKYADILIPHAYKTCAYLSSNMLVPLNNIPNIDLSQAYWKSAVDTISTFGKNTYFAATPGNEHLTGSLVLFFNKKIAKSLNWDPYAQVKNNQWTVSELRRVTKAATRDLDGKSGMTAADQWGMAQIDPGTAGMMALLTGSNLEMIKGSNGKFTYNMDNKDIINTINIGKALFKDDKVNYAGKADADDVKLFTSGHALLLSGGLSNVEQITNMDDDFGLIPFPHSDSQKQYRSNVDWNYTVMMVPKNPKNQKATDVEAQNTGKFLEAFAYLSQDTMKAIKQEYADRHFRDDESSDMLSIIEKGLKMDAAQIFGGQSLWPIHDGTFRVMYETIGDNKDPQTLVDERKKAAITELEKQLAKIK